MTTLTVAACQISASDSPAANLEVIRDAVRAAAAAGAELVVLPEAAMARFGTPLRDVAEPLDGPFAAAVRGMAAEYDVLLVLGMFEPANSEHDAEQCEHDAEHDDHRGARVFNTLLATGRGVEGSYRKIHLYDAFGARESDTVAPGSELVTIDALGTTIGLATCFDVRFAEQFSALRRAGARVVVLPAAWGDGPGKAEQWDLLTRARASDAQAWLVACDQAWSVPASLGATDPLGIGRSVVVDPTGGVRARAGVAPEVLVTTIDLGLVDDVRARIPLG